ncbi:DUF6388 family protein [Pseudomonas sp. nanlin1]|uniref:DUF6388 family protein n=1 Tax=Pseudomonas sp. nanlin1 TaxID=3040605 RepID=UPI00388E51E7
MPEPEQRHQAALERFLSDHPEVASELNNLNPLLARAAGLTPEQYRAERLHEAFEEEAQRRDLFAWELTLQLTAESPEAFQTQRLEVHREVAEMAGMQWADYCKMQGLAFQGLANQGLAPLDTKMQGE